MIRPLQSYGVTYGLKETVPVKNARKSLVRMRGLEPPRDCSRWNLNAFYTHHPALVCFLFNHFQIVNRGLALLQDGLILRTNCGLSAN